MSKFLATVLLIILGLINMLGLYWYGFGLWPQNWWAFGVFTLINIFLFAIRMGIDKEK